MRVPTVIIETDNGPVTINKSDFNAETMTLRDTTAIASGVVETAPPTPLVDENGLRLDGPTVAEYVTAGYPPANYPPTGYAARSTPEEIAAVIAATNPPPAPTPAPVAAPAQLLVTKKGKKSIVVDAAGMPVERDGIDKAGYASEGEAWAAIMALAPVAG